MAPVKLRWGYFVCGRSPVSESGSMRCQVKFWNSRTENYSYFVSSSDTKRRTSERENTYFEFKAHQSQFDTRAALSRRNSIVYLSCLLFPFTSSFLLERKRNGSCSRRTRWWNFSRQPCQSWNDRTDFEDMSCLITWGLGQSWRRSKHKQNPNNLPVPYPIPQNTLRNVSEKLAYAGFHCPLTWSWWLMSQWLHFTAHIPSAVMHVEYMTHAPVDIGSYIISRYRARSVFL